MGGLTEGLTALKNGDIDAAAILEPVYSEQVEEEGWKLVFKASDYVPEFLSTVIITGPGVLQKDRAMVEKTIQARAEGIEFLKRNPDASPRRGPRRPRSSPPARGRRWRPSTRRSTGSSASTARRRWRPSPRRCG